MINKWAQGHCCRRARLKPSDNLPFCRGFTRYQGREYLPQRRQYISSSSTVGMYWQSLPPAYHESVAGRRVKEPTVGAA